MFLFQFFFLLLRRCFFAFVVLFSFFFFFFLFFLGGHCSHSILSLLFLLLFFFLCVLVLSSKELHIARPSSLSNYPFVLSRKTKGEISSDFKEEANSLDTAAKILGVSAGGLLFASVAIGVSNVVSK